MSALLRRASLLGAALALGLGIALAAGAFRGGPSYAKRGSLHCLTDGDELYTFDAGWRKETLRRADPRTGLRTLVVESPPPERMAALRAALLGHLGLKGLEEIPKEKQSDIDAAHSLGYF